MQWYGIIGLIAAVCIAAFTIPQLVQVLKTKNTCGLSAIMLGLLTFGDFCFAINGIGVLAVEHSLSGGLPLLLANAISCTISAILLFLKLRAMHYAKKFQTTEKQFCENYEAYKTKIKMAKVEKDAAKNVEVPKDEKPSGPDPVQTQQPTTPIIE